MLLLGLQAAAWNVPFLPTRAGLGTDIQTIIPELRTVRSPYYDSRTAGENGVAEELIAMPALPLDAALIHMNRADDSGTGQFLGQDPYMDDLMAQAATRCYMSCERVLPADELKSSGSPHSLRTLPSMVHGVIERPGGAHFTACDPDYPRDDDFQREYAMSATSDDAWKTFRARYLDVREEDYQAAVFPAHGIRNEVAMNEAQTLSAECATSVAPRGCDAQ